MKYSKRQFLTINGQRRAVRLITNTNELKAYKHTTGLIIYTKKGMLSIPDTSRKYLIAKNYLTRGTNEDKKLFNTYFDQ